MKILRLFTILCLAYLSSVIALATDETIDLGPVAISLNLESAGSSPTVDKGETIVMDHKKPRFQYEISSASIKVDGTQDKIQLEVHKMSTDSSLESAISERDQTSGLEHCIIQSNIMPVGQDMQTKPYAIDGSQGLLATVNSDQDDPLYIVACSPDQKDGSGSIVCIVGSDFPWKITERIFDSIKIKVA